MPASASEPDIVDVPDERRFVAVKDGAVAELVYRIEGGRLVVVHTGVPEELEGHGLGGRLVRGALDKAQRQQLTLVPLCPFARRWLREHPDDAQRVPVDWHVGKNR
jgi:predicted GNAT family acetyltransferase